MDGLNIDGQKISMFKLAVKHFSSVFGVQSLDQSSGTLIQTCIHLNFNVYFKSFFMTHNGHYDRTISREIFENELN